MEWLIDLWLPVVVITPVLFIASFLAWVVLPHHKPDIRRWPDEDRLLEFVRQSGAEPGEYLFPEESMERTFDEPGEYPYLCEPHEDRGMTGVIRVE